MNINEKKRGDQRFESALKRGGGRGEGRRSRVAFRLVGKLAAIKREMLGGAETGAHAACRVINKADGTELKSQFPNSGEAWSGAKPRAARFYCAGTFTAF